MDIRNTLNNFSLDSFKVRIPIEKVKIINLELNQHRLTVNADTSEIIKEYKENSLSIENVTIFFFLIKSIQLLVAIRNNHVLKA